jgi:hypothetical protein
MSKTKTHEERLYYMEAIVKDNLVGLLPSPAELKQQFEQI